MAPNNPAVWTLGLASAILSLIIGGCASSGHTNAAQHATTPAPPPHSPQAQPVTLSYPLPSSLDILDVHPIQGRGDIAGRVGAATAPAVTIPNLVVTPSSSASIRLNLPLVRRLAVTPDDLLSAQLTFHVVKAQLLSGASLQLAPLDHAAAPLARIDLPPNLQPDDTLNLPLNVQAVRHLMSGQADPQLALSLTGAGGGELELLGPAPLIPLQQQPKLPHLSLTIAGRENHELFDWPVKPRDGVYTTVKDGHLYYGDQRLRLWGVCRYASDDPLEVQRIKKVGFNAVRVWGPRGNWDVFDKYVAQMKKEGMWVMCTALMGSGGGRDVMNDDSWLAKETGQDKADWDAWKAAMQTRSGASKFLSYIDDRAQLIRKHSAADFLNHVNPYTGKRYAEEECIFQYEVANENGFLKWCLEQKDTANSISRWPKYFQDELQRKWNAFLKDKYTDQAGLLKAWGKLDDGENLDQATVKYGPIYPDRELYPAQRGGDFVQFMIGLENHFNQDFRAYCRTLAPSGVGVNVVPFSFDTQYRNNTPWLYADAQADVVCFGMYENRLKSALNRPPGVNVVDTSTVEGKPSVLYEVNRGHPDPHRTEYPMQLAALGSYEDWDGIFWHYFQEPAPPPDRRNLDEDYLVQPIWYVTPGDTDDLWIETDPAMCSATALAGQSFMWRYIAPAANPVIYTVGAKGVFSYDWFNGLSIRSVSWSQGAKIRFDIDNKDLAVDPLPPEPSVAPVQPIHAGDQVTYDWPNGRMIIDTPQFKAYVGRTGGGYQFKDGTTVLFTSPYVTFALSSRDQKDIANDSTNLLVTAVHEAANTGFVYNMLGAPEGFVHPTQRKLRVERAGYPPVLMDKIGYDLWLPTAGQGTMRGFDFALRDVEEAPVDAAHVTLPTEGLYMRTLNFNARGGRTTPPSPGSIAAPAGIAIALPEGAPADASLKGVWAPLSLSDGWGTSPKSLADATGARAVSTDGKTLAMLLSGAPVMNATADVEFQYVDGQLREIYVSFIQPPPLDDVITAVQKALGEPTQRQTAREAYQTSEATWDATSAGHPLTVTVTEQQGQLTIRCQRK